ncbi:MAG: sel1 repeat family protein [Bacteroidaceae bacterium]|nr:sel1 repeat family protein [Bacteroidaceae bacterium]
MLIDYPKMRIFAKSLLLSSLFAVACLSVSAQQITREQLLKLFYQANSAQKKGETEKAIEIYKEILIKAPGLPDPYLQLGDIFYGIKDNARSQRKALISYSQYLKLRPDADNSIAVQQRIDEIEEGFKTKEVLLVKDTTNVKQDGLIAENQDETPEIVVKPVVPKIVVPAPNIDESEITPVQVNNLSSDSLRNMSNETAVKAEKKLLGRWASRRLDVNGKEQWILDLYSRDGDLWMRLNDNSSVLSDVEDINANSLEVKALKLGDEMSFSFDFAQSSSSMQTGKKTGMNGVVAELFDVDFDEFASSFFTSSTDGKDINAAQVTERYDFLLHMMGERLYGKVIKKTLLNGKDSGASVEDGVMLFKVPEDYNGFVFRTISDESKSSNLELRRLFNKKNTEASSSPSALNDLACMLASGIGTKKNMRMAVAHYMEAVAKNNIFAMLNLAKLYQEGNGVEKDIIKARDLYQRAFDAGYTDAMVLCGDAILEIVDGSIDPKEAVKCYEKAVLKRSPYAYFRLGWAYMEGIGVDVDEKRAWSYYQRAVDMQYPDAMAEVGVMYREGLLVKEDVKKAMDLLQKAAAKDSARAMKELSDMYLDGNTVTLDFQKSKDWLQKYMLTAEKLIDGFCLVKSDVTKILRASGK